MAPTNLSGPLEWLTTFFAHLVNHVKANIKYRNVDFNADKTKQYVAARKVMARKYSSGDVDLFGPEETYAIPEDVEESQRKELVEKVNSEKALIRIGYSRVMENINELRFIASAINKIWLASCTTGLKFISAHLNSLANRASPAHVIRP